jgi:hypothetical protein
VHDDHTALGHHWQRSRGGEERADHLIPRTNGYGLVGVEALDVEGLQLFVDEPGKLAREIVPRLKIIAFEQVDRRSPTALDLLTNVGRFQGRLRGRVDRRRV